MTDICTWCVADIGHPQTRLDIKWPAPELDGPEKDTVYGGPGSRNYDQQNGRTPRKLELIREAWANDWPVYMNGGYLLEPPVATWHGDPACAMHLAEQVELERSGRWVRMAQWRR